MITQILNATAERTPTGVILHATGLDATQGAFQAELRAAYAEDGAFSHLEFRIMRPEDATAGPPASRAIVAAGYFTRDETTALRNVTVRGALNSVTVNLR